MPSGVLVLVSGCSPSAAAQGGVCCSWGSYFLPKGEICGGCSACPRLSWTRCGGQGCVKLGGVSPPYSLHLLLAALAFLF